MRNQIISFLYKTLSDFCFVCMCFTTHRLKSKFLIVVPKVLWDLASVQFFDFFLSHFSAFMLLSFFSPQTWQATSNHRVLAQVIPPLYPALYPASPYRPSHLSLNATSTKNSLNQPVFRLLSYPLTKGPIYFLRSIYHNVKEKKFFFLQSCSVAHIRV